MALRTVNRALLGLAGLVLLCAGGAVLSAGLDMGVPSWWPWHGPDAVLLEADERRRWSGQGWWWPVVIAALAVLVVLALVWLLAQFRRPRPAEILVDTRDGEEAAVRGRALEGAMEEEAETLEGVARAHVGLTGRRTAPTARVTLQLEPYASPGAALAALTDEVLAHARSSTGLRGLPAEARLRAAGHGPRRVT
ncbi:alkaline shock response membrane anchor protein AmaP [Streptomyces sp. NPDC047928]|uniref:alkaline shock response membrane anchor protein AmaP n=1 Tax=unclassified Streptomyces TaxID=2593676 RepID=UPI003722E2C6